MAEQHKVVRNCEEDHKLVFAFCYQLNLEKHQRIFYLFSLIVEKPFVAD